MTDKFGRIVYDFGGKGAMRDSSFSSSSCLAPKRSFSSMDTNQSIGPNRPIRFGWSQRGRRCRGHYGRLGIRRPVRLCRGFQQATPPATGSSGLDREYAPSLVAGPLFQ